MVWVTYKLNMEIGIFSLFLLLQFPFIISHFFSPCELLQSPCRDLLFSLSILWAGCKRSCLLAFLRPFSKVLSKEDDFGTYFLSWGRMRWCFPKCKILCSWWCNHKQIAQVAFNRSCCNLNPSGLQSWTLVVSCHWEKILPSKWCFWGMKSPAGFILTSQYG